ncbi:4'-phosphopantetheinyl transferase family protein [Priestia aryabhattai]|uniref:4'-phosphopantetheinyl transferase family protein n=1 Tax=Priestia aryabhattai TaxID=412384 RepID=UPI003D277EDB
MNKIQAYSVPSYIDQSTLRNLLKFVCLNKQARINKFISPKDSYRTLIGDIAVRVLACEKFRISNQEIFYKYNKYGKPYLQIDPSFHFNISHSGDWVVVVSSSEEVGIDIERIQKINFDIAEKYFTISEYNDLLSCREENRIKYFFDLWTLKESYVKLLGKGLSIPLNSFTIIRHSDQFVVKKENTRIKDNLKEVFFKQYNLDNTYSFSACSLDPIFPEDIEIFHLQDLLNMLTILQDKRD